MKNFFKKIRNKIYFPIDRLGKELGDRSNNSEKILQMLLQNQYRLSTGGTIWKNKFSFEEVGFKQYSQNMEDGILLFIFSLIGSSKKNCVEICASNGIRCNTANLIINHGWKGLLFDGDAKLIEEGQSFYNKHPNAFTLPPKFVQAWVTKENVNELIESNGVKGDIDLLSLDLDGVDYWIWNEITCIQPRVVVAEIQCIWGNDRSVTVPYSPDFKAQFFNGFGIYSGASMPAFVSLAKKKGYRLIGVEPYGFNAFFMRNDIGNDHFPEVEPKECTDNIPFVIWAKKKLLPLVETMEWQEV